MRVLNLDFLYSDNTHLPMCISGSPKNVYYDAT